MIKRRKYLRIVARFLAITLILVFVAVGFLAFRI